MRLILAPKSMEGIVEKTSQIVKSKIRAKIPLKITKWKMLQLKIGDDSPEKDSYIDANQEFTRCESLR
jgi:hypothetical protein